MAAEQDQVVPLETDDISAEAIHIRDFAYENDQVVPQQEEKEEDRTASYMPIEPVVEPVSLDSVTYLLAGSPADITRQNLSVAFARGITAKAPAEEIKTGDNDYVIVNDQGETVLVSTASLPKVTCEPFETATKPLDLLTTNADVCVYVFSDTVDDIELDEAKAISEVLPLIPIAKEGNVDAVIKGLGERQVEHLVFPPETNPSLFTFCTMDKVDLEGYLYTSVSATRTAREDEKRKAARAARNARLLRWFWIFLVLFVVFAPIEEWVGVEDKFSRRRIAIRARDSIVRYGKELRDPWAVFRPTSSIHGVTQVPFSPAKSARQIVADDMGEPAPSFLTTLNNQLWTLFSAPVAFVQGGNFVNPLTLLARPFTNPEDIGEEDASWYDRFVLTSSDFVLDVFGRLTNNDEYLRDKRLAEREERWKARRELDRFNSGDGGYLSTVVRRIVYTGENIVYGAGWVGNAGLGAAVTFRDWVRWIVGETIARWYKRMRWVWRWMSRADDL